MVGRESKRGREREREWAVERHAKTEVKRGERDRSP